MTELLSKDAASRVYVGVGKYTSAEICQNFLQEAEKAGIIWQVGENDGVWRGTANVGGWSIEELNLRKANVNWWIGKWRDARDSKAASNDEAR